MKLKAKMYNRTFEFHSVAEVMAKANEVKAGDTWQGIAAESGVKGHVHAAPVHNPAGGLVLLAGNGSRVGLPGCLDMDGLGDRGVGGVSVVSDADLGADLQRVGAGHLCRFVRAERPGAVLVGPDRDEALSHILYIAGKMLVGLAVVAAGGGRGGSAAGAAV